MTNEKIKKMFDACYQAKRIREMLPSLPQGIIPSHIQYMDIIQKMEKEGLQVRVSDLSNALNLPRPGVTRTVKDMEKNGLIQKIASPVDGRVTYLALTKKGENLSQKYNENYFNALAPYLEDISEKDADCMIQTIDKFYHIMYERRNHYE